MLDGHVLRLRAGVARDNGFWSTARLVSAGLKAHAVFDIHVVLLSLVEISAVGLLKGSGSSV